ncbi:hypothetical protein MU852_07895 [Brevundimonas albigilva]|uniref:Uncharacterized protein n=1 Tax=Brevundimonas albigilva TaxID=1312364 RepID=A0ABY4SNN7_9CAUL|nr:hypothetical protein [Brevundimonas albigilva]UQV19642.1 hypothetical protein MU852_07895 [Brevundimonas albigilva]URI15331.1 hypothetical protein M8231_16325 [Brevundimonas albigilva]
MSTPQGLRTPKRIALLIPILVAVVAFIGLAVFSWSHLGAKGPAPQLGSSPEQVATGTTPPTRDAYTTKDFVEPQSE